jgi:hypothetical protein
LAWLTEKIRIFALTEEEFFESQWADKSSGICIRSCGRRSFCGCVCFNRSTCQPGGYRPALEDDLVQTGQLTHAALLGLPALTDKITALHFTVWCRVLPVIAIQPAGEGQGAAQ